MNNNQSTFRRIVTGHDADGKAIILTDAAPTRTYMIGGEKGAKFYEVWHTPQTPALITGSVNYEEEDKLVLGPPAGGTRIRVIDFPAESEEIRNLSKEQAQEHFKSMSDEKASRAGETAPHPLMHRTETIDYGIVLDGELTMILDRGETTVKAGDIIIQRGTNHAWANRSGKPCRVAFILISAKFGEGLSK